MPLDTRTFIDQLGKRLRDHPDQKRLRTVLEPLGNKLMRADQRNDKDEVAAVYLEIQEALKDALVEKPDAPIDIFTDKALLIEDMIPSTSWSDMLTKRKWLDSEYEKRLDTYRYFDFADESVDGELYPPPSSDDIRYGMTTAKMDLIGTFQKPIMIMTPIGISMGNLIKTFNKRKGAMAEHAPTRNEWNNSFEESEDFDHDLRGEMLYGAMSRTKLEILEESQSRCKGWQVLVVEGADSPPEQQMTAAAFIEDCKKNGFDGLTPEDAIMLQAEGLRAGKPFIQGKDRTWLAGAVLVMSGKPSTTPRMHWARTSSRVRFSCNPGDANGGWVSGSRRAVRII